MISVKVNHRCPKYRAIKKNCKGRAVSFAAMPLFVRSACLRRQASVVEIRARGRKCLETRGGAPFAP
jgi:hypothetical protein